jgi:hypothetical protein
LGLLQVRIIRAELQLITLSLQVALAAALKTEVVAAVKAAVVLVACVAQ